MLFGNLGRLRSAVGIDSSNQQESLDPGVDRVHEEFLRSGSGAIEIGGSGHRLDK